MHWLNAVAIITLIGLERRAAPPFPAYHHCGYKGSSRRLRLRRWYSTSIDMKSALHQQTILTLDFLGAPLTGPIRRSAPPEDLDQTRLQESKIHRCRGGHQQMDRRALGQSGLQLVQRIMNLRILAVVILLGLTAGTAFWGPSAGGSGAVHLAGLFRLPAS